MNRDATGEVVRLRRFAGPRYWPIWIFLWLARGIAWLPYSWQIRIGAGIGHLSYFLARRRRGICEVNLRLCFPELDSGERKRLVRRTFVSNGIGLLEVAISWFRDPEDFRSRASIEGLEHLREAVAKGRGVLLVAAHFTTLEIGGFLLSLFHPMAVTYRAHENPLFDAMMFNCRRRHYPRVVERRDVRGMLRCLHDGLVVWYAPDQDYGPRRAVFAPFFGVKARRSPQRAAMPGRTLRPCCSSVITGRPTIRATIFASAPNWITFPAAMNAKTPSESTGWSRPRCANSRINTSGCTGASRPGKPATRAPIGKLAAAVS